MILKGQKRKIPSEDEVSDQSSSALESQRHFVFSVSLIKYQRSQELPEPSLRRYVLITNTLRQVSPEHSGTPSGHTEVSQPPCSSLFGLQVKEQESISTGVPATKHQLAFTADDSYSARVSSHSASFNYFVDSAASRSSTSSHDSSESISPMAVEDEDWGSMSTEPDFDVASAVASILSGLDSTVDGSPQAAPRTPFRSLENLPEPEGGVVWEKQGAGGYCKSWEQQLQEEAWAQEGSLEVMRASYLSDLTLEDLFQDIDMSVLETDVEVLGVRSGGGGYPAGDDFLCYLPPFTPSASSSDSFSITLNSSLKCLPSFSSFSPSSSSSSSLSPSVAYHPPVRTT